MAKQIHISIDDVWQHLDRLKSDKLLCVWDEKLFKYIRFIHRLTGAKFTLYVFYQYEHFNIHNVQDIYQQEYEEVSDWLKFAFHAVSEEQNEENVLPEFSDKFVETANEIKRFAGEKSLANVLRLHYWFYPNDYVSTLKRNGIHTILVKENQNDKISGFQKWETNIRIESNSMRSILKKFWHHNQEQPLVIFTHEWALNRRNKIKLLIIVIMAKMLKYQFICE